MRAGASGDNPVPSPPGRQRGSQGGSVYDHHIDWDAKVTVDGAAPRE